MNMKEFRGFLERGIMRDQKWLEEIESILQKVSQQNPANKKIIGPLRGLKRTALNQIKVYEKALARTTRKEVDQNPGPNPSKS